MNYANFTTDELINRAMNERNHLAIAILEGMETEIEDTHAVKVEELETLIDEIANDMTVEMDDKITAYADDYYLNAEGDYLAEYGYLLSESPLDLAGMQTRLREELRYGRFVSGLTQESEDKLLNLSTEQLADLDMAITADVESSTVLEVRHTFSSAGWSDLYSFCIGEVEEMAVEWLEVYRPELREKMTQLSSHHFKDEYLYINLSDSHASYSLDLDWLEEALTQI